MKIFNVDMDNTLIYSYKHDIGKDKINVELYNGREISYITEKTFELLNEVSRKYLIVPTTTRTKEQYERLFLGIGKIKYALVCNGGVLLVDGKKDENWYNVSKQLISESMCELRKGLSYLEKEKSRKFEVRFIEELFVFTKCDEPEAVVCKLKDNLNLSLVDVFNNGVKVYVVPKKLDKGTAVKRFREYIEEFENVQEVVAAGDSEFDIPMVKSADKGLVPKGFINNYDLKCDNAEKIYEMPGKKVFAEELLEMLYNRYTNY